MRQRTSIQIEKIQKDQIIQMRFLRLKEAQKWTFYLKESNGHENSKNYIFSQKR